jgi:hypothetical protein
MSDQLEGRLLEVCICNVLSLDGPDKIRTISFTSIKISGRRHSVLHNGQMIR